MVNMIGIRNSMAKKIRYALYHVNMILAAMYIVFYFIDRVNSAMAFINNDITKGLLYALGVASILWPEKVHFFGSRWRYAHAELSSDGIAVQILSGIANIVLAIVLMYMPLFW